MEFLEACQKLISIDTSPQHGTRDACLFLQELATQWNLQAHVFEGDQPHQMNIIVRSNDEVGAEADVPQTLFQAHLDTGEPGPLHLWSETHQDPLRAVIRDDRLYGLGTADSKLDFLCKMQALKEAAASGNLSSGIAVAGTYGGELPGLKGARQLLETLPKKPERIFVGLPSEMALVTRSNAILFLEIEIPWTENEIALRQRHMSEENTAAQSRYFKGRPVHSSTPELGECANIKLLKYLRSLPRGAAIVSIDGGVALNQLSPESYLELDLSKNIEHGASDHLSALLDELQSLELEFHRYPDPEMTPAIATLNVGFLKADNQGVRVGLSLRFPPKITSLQVDLWTQKLRDFCWKRSIHLHVKDYKAPFQLSRSPTVDFAEGELKILGIEKPLVQGPKASEAAVFQSFDIEALPIGPGSLTGVSHAPNEYCQISELTAAKQFYVRMMEKASL